MYHFQFAIHTIRLHHHISTIRLRFRRAFRRHVLFQDGHWIVASNPSKGSARLYNTSPEDTQDFCSICCDFLRVKNFAGYVYLYLHSAYLSNVLGGRTNGKIYIASILRTCQDLHALHDPK